jgi:hypothetical protein
VSERVQRIAALLAGAGFDTTAIGNIETLPPAADAKPGLHLRKSLCRDQQPQARVSYRKQTPNIPR